MELSAERAAMAAGRRPSTTRATPPRVAHFEWNGEQLAVISRARADGDARLTAAERDIVAAVARGLSNAEIAAARGTSARTVANQIAALLRKHRAHSRYDLVRVLGNKR